MKIQHSFPTTRSEAEAREIVAAFFSQAQYKPVATQPDLVYRRGSLLGSLVSFSPRGWQCTATVRTLPDGNGSVEVQVELEVNTTGQAVTAKEREFWRNEVHDLETSLGGEGLCVAASTAAARSSLGQNVAAVVAILVVAVLVTLVATWWQGKYVGTLVGIGSGIAVTLVVIWGLLGARSARTEGD